MIKRLKFSGDLKFARIVGQLLTEAVAHSERPDALIPIPLHPNRSTARGFNQAELLAKHVAGALLIPVQRDGISRTKDNPAQSGLNASQREKNLQSAFFVHTNLTGKHVAILDDVVTTGTTARAMARQLRRAGAIKISLWAVARTP